MTRGGTAPVETRTGGIQSIGRAFLVLETIAEAGGVLGLSQLATACDLPLATIHRQVRTLVDLGYLHQDASRRYSLSPRLIRLGESSAQMLHTFARPHLARLVEEIGETANLARLDGDAVVYVAQAPGRHSMRMFTEVGRRVSPHCTGVGKVLLAHLEPDAAEAMVSRIDMPAETEYTITDPTVLLHQLKGVRERGYAVDDGEQEVGVRCLAVPVPDAPTPLALSISGPATRMDEDLRQRAIPEMTAAAQALASDLRDGAAQPGPDA